jgi:hypothetical protein
MSSLVRAGKGNPLAPCIKQLLRHSAAPTDKEKAPKEIPPGLFLMLL